jgi:4-hydroxy-4-methyl-2-oxoglutarate aldolase
MRADPPTLAVFGSGLIADALREVGHLDRTVFPALAPLAQGWHVVGRCRTAHWVQTTEVDAGNYLELARLIDRCQPGECIVMGSSDGASPGSVWGELCATEAVKRRLGGVVIDGYLRDTLRLLEVGLPTFSAGALARDYQGRSRLAEYDTEIICGGVTVRPGDLVVADVDGVVFVPAQLEGDVLREATKKLGQEREIAQALAAGKTLTEAVLAAGTL